MSDIVELNSDPITAPGEPIEEVVEMLESYLEQARNGRIRAIVFGVIEIDGSFITGWKGETESTECVALSALLARRIVKWADGD